jgi:hypothetical protein
MRAVVAKPAAGSQPPEGGRGNEAGRDRAYRLAVEQELVDLNVEGDRFGFDFDALIAGVCDLGDLRPGGSPERGGE